MRMFKLLLLSAVTMSMAPVCFPSGVLEDVRKIQVDATVIEQPDKIKDKAAAKLVRYDLRAAVRDALFEEGDSPVRAHFVLDEFSPQGGAKRLMDFGTGRSIRTVEGTLVVLGAGGKELASVRIHFRGSIAFDPAEGNPGQGRQPASEFEQRLLQEIERLK